MKKEYLPIGSVVLLKNAKKRLMITGFYVKLNDADKFFDYLGCIYPEGMVSEHENYLFNNDNIEKVVYYGLIDDEEITFKSKLYEIIDSVNNSDQNDSLISIPVKLYDQFNTSKNDIISIPLDEYNKTNNRVISVPADLYKEACRLRALSASTPSNLISIPASVYTNYNEKNNKKRGFKEVNITEKMMSKDLGVNVIRIPYNEYMKSNKNSIINIPFETYKMMTEKVITIPASEYERLINDKSVIRINALSYNDFLKKEEDKKRVISIPRNLYERLQKKEDIISVPLNVYEKLMKSDEKDIISIPIDEYERLTRAKEDNGIISLPSSVYNELLRKEKSNIDNNPSEIIEIPFDIYSSTVVGNN